MKLTIIYEPFKNYNKKNLDSRILIHPDGGKANLTTIQDCSVPC